MLNGTGYSPVEGDASVIGVDPKVSKLLEALASIDGQVALPSLALPDHLAQEIDEGADHGRQLAPARVQDHGLEQRRGAAHWRGPLRAEVP